MTDIYLGRDSRGWLVQRNPDGFGEGKEYRFSPLDDKFNSLEVYARSLALEILSAKFYGLADDSQEIVPLSNEEIMRFNRAYSRKIPALQSSF